jgi:hypothetical protein
MRGSFGSWIDPLQLESSQAATRLDGWDMALVALFLLGLYLGVSIPLTRQIPITCAPAGVAGLLLLWRRRDQINAYHLAGLFAVLLVYMASIVSASDWNFLQKRFTGLLQLTYSLLISYALFLTLVQSERRQIAAILLTLCIAILLGCLWETYGDLRPLSDRVRNLIFDRAGIYDADLRDELLYGRVRPKLFTSEPSAVTFAFTQFASTWLVISVWRWKAAVYGSLLAGALFILPGPTLILMFLLLVPYLVFLAGRRQGQMAVRLFGAAVLSLVVLGIGVAIGKILFAERLNEMAAGRDASFFYRFTGPMLVAFDMFSHYPFAGAGLTGEPFIADRVMNVFMNSGAFQSAWRITKIADALTNYFWLHWIYLGVVWGVLTLVALSLWLRTLGAGSLGFCWAVWVILGQASGAYVGPKTWSVLLMSAAASVLALRPAAACSPSVAPSTLPLLARPRLHRRHPASSSMLEKDQSREQPILVRRARPTPAE